MYQFPIKEDELDNHISTSNGLKLRSYGLPYIFWGYFAGGAIILFFMALAIKNPVIKLYQTDDSINQLLVISVVLLISTLPIVALGFLFFEKNIIKNKLLLIIKLKTFGITLMTRRINLENNNSLSVDKFFDSPNIAKINSKKEFKQFENQGYFSLNILSDQKKILLDRSNRKQDLIDLKNLLQKY